MSSGQKTVVPDSSLTLYGRLQAWIGNARVSHLEGNDSLGACLLQIERLLEELHQQTAAVPVPLLLNCPGCGERHFDEGVWATRPHRVHACQVCGMQWAPALVYTVGVRFLPGCKNGMEASGG